MSAFRFEFEVSPTENKNQATLCCSNKTKCVKNDPVDIDKLTGGDKKPLVFVNDVSSLLQERSSQSILVDTLPLISGTENIDSALSPLLRTLGSNSAKVDIHIPTSTTERIVQDLETKQTDILPGVYEGGLKLWECSVDVCHYMAKNWNSDGENISRALPPRGGFVLELGCGQGMPGCFLLRERLLRRSSSHPQDDPPLCVLFNDYNEFVLRDVTLSNIMLNTLGLANEKGQDAKDIAKHVVLAGGDWMELSAQLQSGSAPQQQRTLQPECPVLPANGRFDLIVAAETTYTDKAAQDTATLLTRHLVFGTGLGLIATKRYYFGVRGGSDAFRSAAASQSIAAPTASGVTVEYVLSVDTLEVYDNGVGNIRELLGVKLVPKSSKVLSGVL